MISYKIEKLYQIMMLITQKLEHIPESKVSVFG